MPKPDPSSPRRPTEGEPPKVDVCRRKGRFVTTGDDTPTLITLAIMLICMIIFPAVPDGL